MRKAGIPSSQNPSVTVTGGAACEHFPGGAESAGREISVDSVHDPSPERQTEVELALNPDLRLMLSNLTQLRVMPPSRAARMKGENALSAHTQPVFLFKGAAPLEVTGFRSVSFPVPGNGLCPVGLLCWDDDFPLVRRGEEKGA